MSGGLMQLVAYGAQDIYLTGNPQITFFKLVYRRCTNFAIESIEQTFNGVGDFGRRVTCLISRNGDLSGRPTFRSNSPASKPVDAHSVGSMTLVTGSFRTLKSKSAVNVSIVNSAIGSRSGTI